ncbi:MAG TPA: hypothetical protein VJR29_04415, partial [bacterium]|nr:hypothetical protein [bacterium]
MKKAGSIHPAAKPWMVDNLAEGSRPLDGAEALLAAEPATPHSTRKLQRFTAAAKTLGLDLSDLLDEKGRLPAERFATAKLRVLELAKKSISQNLDSSVRLFQSALQLEPQDPGLHLALANAYFTRANRAKNSELRETWIREGRAELELILRRNPRHVEALRTKALSHGLDPGFLGDDGRILHPELLPEFLRNLEPAQIFAGLAYGASLKAEAGGDRARAQVLLEAAAEMDPRHALAQIGLAERSLADGQLRKARNHLRLALEHAATDADLDRLHALLSGKGGNKLLPKGEKSWIFLGNRLFEAGRHGLARKAFQAAAASDPKGQAEWTRRAQLADERERPYEREFASLSAPNPMAAALYEALKRQGIPDEAMDSVANGGKDRRLSHREIYDYIGAHLSDSAVQAALQEEGLEIPKGENEKARHQGFAGFMAERLSSEARALQQEDPGSAEATDKLERALYFDPDKVERHLALADAYSAEGHQGAAVEVLVGAARLAPQDRALSQRLLSTHEKALEQNYQAAEKLSAQGRPEEAKALLARSAEQQESLRGLLNREKPLEGALNPSQVDTWPQLAWLGKSRLLLAQILERQGQGGEAAKVYRDSVAILGQALKAETGKEPLERRFDVRRALHSAADSAGEFGKALGALRSATHLVSMDVEGQFQPYQELWNYEDGLRRRLNEAHGERVRAEEEMPPDSARIVELLQTEKKLNEALGHKKEALALDSLLGEAGDRQRLEGMIGQGRRFAAAGHLEPGSLQRTKAGEGLGVLSEYVSLTNDESGAPSFAFTAAYESLRPAQQTKVAEALLRCGRRSELASRALTEADPVKKLYYEVKLAQLDGPSRELRRKAETFVASTASSTELAGLRREVEGIVARFEAEAQAELGKVSEEVRALIGPLVPSLYRDANGALDMSKVRAAGPGEFKQWLLDQMWIEGRKLSDLAGYSARWRGVFDNYRLVFQSSEFDSLLTTLFQSGQAAVAGSRAFAPGEGLERVRALTRELATVSPTQFASTHLSSKEGRARLRAILEDQEHFDSQLRVDLVRAIGRTKSQEGAHGLQAYLVGKQSATVDLIVFDLNISNLAVDAKQREQAVRVGLDILGSIDEIEVKTEERRQKYLFEAEKVRGLRLPDGGRIGGDEIRRLAEIQERNKDRPDPVSQLRTKLAGAWLLAADDDNWREGGIAATPANRAHLLQNAERLLARLDGIQSEAQLQSLIQDLRRFLAAPLPTDSKALKWADEILQSAQDLPVLNALPASTGLGRYLEEDMLGEMAAADREPFDGLKGLADEMGAAIEMGESLPLRIEGFKSQDPKFRSAVENYIQGLERAKRGMWAGYKQKHWLYRGLATEGGLLAEDIPNIRAANQAIDGIIEKLKAAESAGDIRRVNQEIYAMSKAGGLLYK